MQSAVNDESGLKVAAAMIERALLAPEGDVSPAVETTIQNALYALRFNSRDRELVQWVEEIAASIRMLADAKRQGRTNFYMSQLLRLRRRVFH